MNPPLPVALVGFSEFERRALGSFFRLAAPPALALELVREPAAARLLVADGGHAGAMRQVAALGRVAHTVFVGGEAPAGAAAQLQRPIDALQVLRAIETLARSLPQPPAAGDAAIELPTAMRKYGPSFSALLVDDSAIALRHLQLRLQRMGIDSDLAHGSGRALELLTQRAYGFVFIDVELGEGSALDGLALCQHIRRQHRHMDRRAPVLVMVSAHHSQEDRVRGTLAGCDHYLAKPPNDEVLHQLLSQHRPGPARRALAP
jgi:CheY-like chemotaxis protein